jgi:caffeoyl-CoA O-methyltransferase
LCGTRGTRLPTLKGQFDLIYIDAAEEEYEAYTRFILDHRLLSPKGVILVDDGRPALILLADFLRLTYCHLVLLEGLVVDGSIAKNFPQEIQAPYLAIADRMNEFNRCVTSDPRIEVTMIPVFNGMTQIMWK